MPFTIVIKAISFSATYLVAIRLLQAIQIFEEKYFPFYRIYINFD